ncbi:hypothetical protein JMJ77_0002020 [Colletotrichum scovillei]|uniref:Uncharacterized protein n=1 Tax=Colletotrichum scovillei TaxID=1209932 RepID=A0A9P7UDS8_9PEZI|nr:hypothetical protein JMJ77_0002020 [Colletotrichum scovillei]KAG7070433.1 hypothetical protein JMJ76_0001686 [Colletotrichum scovillei]KAG7078708.1 hypothetical protein JMJ78_0002376 [Colletotrichum scovillei]
MYSPSFHLQQPSARFCRSRIMAVGYRRKLTA